jgi:hypothetical protein
MVPGFPVAFRQPAFASWASCSRQGFPPLSRSAYRTSQPGPDGFSTFHTSETRPDWAPSLPRGQRCSHDRLLIAGRRRRLFQRLGPITPVHVPPPGAARNEASSRVHSRSPARPSPHPVVPPDGAGALRLLPWASHPNKQDLRRTPERGRASSTHPKLRNRQTSALQSASPLAMCNFVSQSESRSSCNSRPVGPQRGQNISSRNNASDSI